MRTFKAIGLLAVFLISGVTSFGQQPSADPKINDLLEPIRQKFKLPALAAAVVTSDGLKAIGAVGIRKSGTDVPVTVDDQWHLGSDTKAMTATLIGALVEQGKLRWDSSLKEIFPDIAPSLPEKLQQVTVLQLLSHRAGLPHDLQWLKYVIYGSCRNQRRAVLEDLANVTLVADPGTKFEYSNVGYVVASAIAEKVADDSWENLISKTIFQPLGMNGVGFGGSGTSGQIDQPWGHAAGGVPFPFHGAWVDNAPVMAPAGGVHCALADWAKFIADQLRGELGAKALLKPETYQVLHTPTFAGDYALGWMVSKRQWGGGTVLSHGGTNTMNYSIVWMAPKKNFAFLACTNQGGNDAAMACDAAVTALIGLMQ